MRVLVVGAGAIGSVLGGFLAKSGHEVTLLGRAWHLDVIRRQGLSIRGIWGEHDVRTLSLITSPDELAGRPPFEWIFVCVKSYDTASVASLLAQWVEPETLVCAFQNGLGNYETLTQHVAAERLAVGRVIFGVELEPGRVLVTVCADDLLIGAPDSRVPESRLHALVNAFRSSGIPARPTETILVALWAKVLYNCALNGLSTALEVPYGVLLQHILARRLMERVVEEAYRIAAAHRIALEPPTPAAYRELLFTRLIPDTAVHYPSMLQDLRRGRPTEVEALNGALVRLAHQVGLEAPINQLITRLVHEKERFAGVAPLS